MRFLQHLLNRKTAAPSPERDNPTAGAASETERKVERVNSWREQYNPLRGISMQRAVSWLEQAQRGEFADVQWAYSFVERRDPDLLAIVDRRTGALLQMDWDIKTVERRFKIRGMPFDAQLAADQQALLRGAYDGFKNLYEAIEHLAMATFRGYSHVQFLAEGELLKSLNCLDQWNILRNGYKGEWYWNPTAVNRSAQTAEEPNKLNPQAYVIRENRRPVNEIALVKFLRDNLSAKDWDGFLEIYGIPGWIIVMAPNIPAGKEAEYQAAATSIAEGGSGALPNGSDAKCADQPRGVIPFEQHLRYWSEKLVLAGTGGLLTMLTAPGSGTLAGSAHQEAFDVLARKDARQISECLQRSIDSYLLKLHFPGQPALAYFDIAANDEQDVGDILDHAVKIVAAGGQVDWTQLSEKTGYKISAAPPPAAPPAFGQPPYGLRNRAPSSSSADVDASLRTAATAALAQAERLDMAPLALRLRSVLALEDPALIRTALETLRKELPDLARDILADPAVAGVLADTSAAALVNGYADGVAARSDTAELQNSARAFRRELIANNFDPSQPRDDDGKWTASGAVAGKYGLSAASRGEDNKWRAGGKELGERVDKLSIPPAWKSVFVSEKADSDLQAVGIDQKGRVQRIYSKEFAERQATKKFSRVQAMDSQFKKINGTTRADMTNAQGKTRESAAALALIQATGIRPGSTTDTKAEKQAFGATTLEGRHVVVSSGAVRLQFTGKKGVALDIPVTDPAIAKELVARKSKAGSSGKLFATTDEDVRDYTKTVTGGKFKPKDFRTRLGTETAKTLVEKESRAASMKEYKKKVRAIAVEVSRKLGNTPTIALQSYIDPHVFQNIKPLREAA